MTDLKPGFETRADSGQVTTEVPASDPRPAVDEPREALIDQDRNRALEVTYDQAAHSRLPGVDVRGAEVHRPYGQPH